MPRPVRGAFLLGVVAGAAVLGACGGGSGVPTRPPEDELPGAGLVVISGDPALAALDLSIRYVSPQGEVSAASVEVRAGETIAASAWDVPGSHLLEVNGVVCEGSYEIETDRLTEVTLVVLDGAGCETIERSIGPLPSG